ncbi:MAG: response regulator [Candidatus Nanoarchaeia archaeon]|nr:response regulator [Candidatus Nanoarchaeia archaeon]
MANILIVEDEIQIRQLILDLLKTQSIEGNAVSGAEEALKIIKSQKIDLLILDLQLSGKMDGIDLLKKLKKRKKEIKVIVTTANAGMITSDFKKEFKSIIVDVISKPFDISDLIKKIKETLRL